MFNYATKSEVKIVPGVDTSAFLKKLDLSSLKSDVVKLGTDKLKLVPTKLNNLESKLNKTDIDKLITVPVELKKSY